MRHESQGEHGNDGGRYYDEARRRDGCGSSSHDVSSMHSMLRERKRFRIGRSDFGRNKIRNNFRLEFRYIRRFVLLIGAE